MSHSSYLYWLKVSCEATFAHGLATAYVGFTAAFGPVLIEWADRHFACRFANGPSPRKTLARGWAAVREELVLWFRCIADWAITALLLGGLIAFIDDAAATRELQEWFRIAFASVGVWFLFGPVWRLVFFRRSVADR